MPVDMRFMVVVLFYGVAWRRIPHWENWTKSRILSVACGKEGPDSILNDSLPCRLVPITRLIGGSSSVCTRLDLRCNILNPCNPML